MAMTVHNSAATTAALRLLAPAPRAHCTIFFRFGLPLAQPTSRWSGGPRRAPAPRMLVRCAAVEKIGEGEFEAEVLNSELPVLVEFIADWCGPCRLVAPIVEWASKEYAGKLKVVKIDHDANPKLIEEYKVYGLPALILFKNGQEVPGSRKEGALTKAKLKEYLESVLQSTSVS